MAFELIEQREFFGLASFDHPSPAPLDELVTHFPDQLDAEYKALLIPSVSGESIPGLHERVATTMSRIITSLDNARNGPKSVLLCTHAAIMICIGRVLTGRKPEDPDEEDFKCYTCSLSKFERKKSGPWSPARADEASKISWVGTGLNGGWECALNGDCSFLSGGEERGWKFSGDEAFLSDPNAFNDAANATPGSPHVAADTNEGEGSEGGGKSQTSKL